MINAAELVNNLVAYLRDIPELVAEMGGDAERIRAYHYRYPTESSIALAIHTLPSPGILVAWRGSGPGSLGDLAAWAFSFALGKSVKSGISPNFTYTITPLSPPTDGIELPDFSFIEQIRPGASDVLDRMAVGCAVEGLTLQVGSGPGRANSKLTVDFVGSGKLTEPSAITLPSPTVEKLLPASSVALTINGTNYVSSKRIVSLEMTWRNNLRLDAGFFPGSGFQTPGDGASSAIRGRLECGDRVATLNFTARFEDGSDELTKLKNQTTGTATIQLTFDADNDLLITFHQLSFKVATVNETDGLVTVAVECQVQYHATNGLLTAVAKCNTDNIGQ